MAIFRLTLTVPDTFTYRDMRDALRYISAYTVDYRGPKETLEIYDHAQVKDANGNVIGKWEIEQ